MKNSPRKGGNEGRGNDPMTEDGPEQHKTNVRAEQVDEIRV